MSQIPVIEVAVMASAPPVPEKPAPKEKPPVPPEERFWTRYSPHFELPLAGATSFFLHAFVLALLALGGLAFLFGLDPDKNRPPQMSVVMVEGAGGEPEGLSGEAGFPGTGAEGKTEVVQGDPASTETPTPDLPDTPPELKPAPEFQLTVPTVDVGPAPSSDVLAQLDLIGQEAEDQVQKALEAVKKPAAPATKRPSGTGKPGAPNSAGTGNPKGVGGLGGPGTGPGLGKKQGPGAGGQFGSGGRKATQQEILAWRWRFELAGDGKQHADKLAAMGVTLAIPDQAGAGFKVIRDLRRRPVELQSDNLAQFQDAVKWYNTTPESLAALARELRLPYTPRFVVLFLPKEREDKMAEAEQRYAERNRRSVHTVRATYFDFQLRGGDFEPIVIRQE